ncbi:putative retrotransposon protein [Tanacetum coccineum]
MTVLIRISKRISQAPDKYGFYVDAEEHELKDLDEPPNYKAVLLDPESGKWLDVMNAETQSIKDNQVWCLVDFLPNGRTNKRFDEEIKKVGFTQNLDEPFVYLKASGSNVAFLFLYVADILIMGNNVTMLQDVKSWLSKCFSMKDLGEAAYILGIKITRDRSKRLIALSQSAYFDNILKNLRWKTPSVVVFRCKKNPNLSKSQGANTPSEVNRMQRVPYASAIRSIMYATDKDDTKSQSGYVFVLNGGAVEWKSAKQSTIAMSSIEAEYIAAAKASMKAVWMRKFIDRLGNVVPTNKRPMEMLCGNMPAIAIANNPIIMKGARHYQRKYHYIRKVIQDGEIVLKKFTHITM